MRINNEILTKTKELLKKYEPEVITATGLCHGIMMGHAITQHRIKALSEAYETTAIAYNSYRQRVFRLTHSNNWLKMHGYPMRRKSRK